MAHRVIENISRVLLIGFVTLTTHKLFMITLGYNPFTDESFVVLDFIIITVSVAAILMVWDGLVLPKLKSIYNQYSPS